MLGGSGVECAGSARGGPRSTPRALEICRLDARLEADVAAPAYRPVNVSLASSALASNARVRAVGFATPCSMRLTTL